MFDQHFLSPSAPSSGGGDVFGPLEGGEREMWRGRCGVAEYAFDEAASMPRWTLPETTEVMVTDRRVLYADAPTDGKVRSGELRWLWPQHLRVQPGARNGTRGAAATQIQLVCNGADGTFPALVFAGGDLATVSDADRVANTIRQVITRFRIDNAGKLGLDTSKIRMLSRLLIGPEFRNHQGGEGQTVSMLGAMLVARPAAPSPVTPDEPALLDEATPLLDRAESTRLINYRPGQAADAARALLAERAEQEALRSEPEVATRAADLAARIADMVSATTAVPEPEPVDPPAEAAAGGVVIEFPLRMPRHSEPRIEDGPTTNLAARAESMRKTAARMAGNRGKAIGRPTSDREPGVSSRGNRNR